MQFRCAGAQWRSAAPALTGLSGPRMRPLCARFYAVVIEKFFIRRKMMGISYAIIDCVYVSLYVFEAFYVFAFLVHRC